MIKPTIGRVVLFKLNQHQSQPFPALVCAVHSDKRINVAGFDDLGNPIKFMNVPLLQDDDPVPQGGFYAEWMPYQKEQAAKDEAAPNAKLPSEQSIEQEIQDKDLTAPRITPAHIDSVIADEQYHVFPGTTLTVCCLTLQNGFTVTGENACASPQNFDAELGKRIARDNAREKIWSLEGYLLKSKLAEPSL